MLRPTTPSQSRVTTRSAAAAVGTTTENAPYVTAVDAGTALSTRPHLSTHWRDFYAPTPLSDDVVLPKPPAKLIPYTTKWKMENPNPKCCRPQLTNSWSIVPTAYGRQAYYGNPMMGGMYPGMGGMGGMGMGMYPGMSGMSMMNPYGMMGGAGYGMPRYGAGLYGGYGGYGYPGMCDPMLGQYGAPPAANFVDDFQDAHRIEHAYRQSAPDAYGMGMGMMGGGMGINNMPGSQVMLYGRGMPYNGWYA